VPAQIAPRGFTSAGAAVLGISLGRPLWTAQKSGQGQTQEKARSKFAKNSIYGLKISSNKFFFQIIKNKAQSLM